MSRIFGRLVLGLERPDEGRVLFQGVDIGRLRGRARLRARRRMHLILQDPYESLHPGMRVREAIAEPLAIAGVGSAERPAAGRRRARRGRPLPGLRLPTSMLDATLRAGILELVTRMRDRHGAAFLFITHDLAVARHVSDRIAVVRAGRIVEIDEPERLVATPREDYTKTLLAASEGEL